MGTINFTWWNLQNFFDTDDEDFPNPDIVCGIQFWECWVNRITGDEDSPIYKAVQKQFAPIQEKGEKITEEQVVEALGIVEGEFAYKVDGLEIVNIDVVPEENLEAVMYQTPKGTKFALARDAMGIQFCKNGCFWPSPMPFPSMEEAVGCLRENTQSAITFFEGAKVETKEGD